MEIETTDFSAAQFKGGGSTIGGSRENLNNHQNSALW